MEYTRPSYHLHATVREREFPAGVIVENQLRV
jgi:hypothetical protein